MITDSLQLVNWFGEMVLAAQSSEDWGERYFCNTGIGKSVKQSFINFKIIMSSASCTVL